MGRLVEQPVSTGFSQGIPNVMNEDNVAAQLVGFLQQFLETFRKLKGKQLCLSGESVRRSNLPSEFTYLGLLTPGNQAPFAQLDALYSFIFASIDNIEAVLDVFMLLLLKCSAEFPKDRISVVKAFWGYQPGDLQIILADMHSVILVPLSQDSKLRIYHASLGDLSLDQSHNPCYSIYYAEVWFPL